MQACRGSKCSMKSALNQLLNFKFQMCLFYHLFISFVYLFIYFLLDSFLCFLITAKVYSLQQIFILINLPLWLGQTSITRWRSLLFSTRTQDQK